MKKITFSLIFLCFSLVMNAQFSFNPITEPISVAAGIPVTINLNDVANASSVPASSTGSYGSFSITADWVSGNGNPWSNEADMTIVTTLGSITVDPPSTGGASTSLDTTLTFEGDFPSLYNPIEDGYIDLVLNQSFGGSDAIWSNIVVNLFETPSCNEPSGMTTSNITSNTATIEWISEGSETEWTIEYNDGNDFTPGNGEQEGSVSVTSTTNTTLTGLTPATTYFSYYQANCGSGDFSIWVGPFTFNTQCETLIAPYSEDFENAGNIPLCWSMSGGQEWFFSDSGGTDHIGSNGTITGNTASNNYFAWCDSSQNNGIRTLTSPFVDVSGLVAPALSFYEISDNEGNANSTLMVEVWDGATWNTMATYNTNTDGWELKILDLSTLTITGNVQARFVFSETETGGFSDDIAIDDVTFDEAPEAPSCLSPTLLTANELGLTSAEINWTEVGTATTWNIEYGIEGFTQGTGTIVTDITTNSFLITDLVPDMSYQFYVQSVCSSDDVSAWSISGQFYVGYCESVPSSNDGDGVANVTIGSTDFPSLGDVTYENHTATITNVFLGTTNFQIDFGHSFSYDTNIWIDFNDDLVLDETELIFEGESSGDGSPHALYASFEILSTANIGEHRMRIVTTDVVQQTPNPCYNDSWGVTLDFTVNVQQLNCIMPEASYATVADCEIDSFYIDVNITSLGDATSLEISNDYDSETLQVNALGLYQAGPFLFGNTVQVFVTNEQDNNCAISSELFDVLACPPSNDECETAIMALVNDGFSCEVLTSGTILAATPSGLENNICNGTPNDDVWFSFTALSEVQIISFINIEGGTSNLNHILYEGSCGALTEVYCSDNESSITPNLTVGTTYFLRVFSEGDTLETSTFDLCIKEAQSNFICDNASMFCTENGVLTTSNITGIESFGQVACLGSTPNPSWNAIQIGDAGLVELEIVQTNFDGNGLDVDFAIWGPFNSIASACNEIIVDNCPTCPSNTTDSNFYPFGNIIDCSYSASSVENVTIDNGQTGEVYILLVTNFNGSSGTITIEQTNVGEEGSGTLSGDFDIALGPDINLCESEEDSVNLNASSPFADNYEWYFNGLILYELSEVSTIEVTESGIYTVIAYNENCDTFAEDEIVVSFIDCENAGIISVSAFYDDNENSVFDGTESNFTNGYFTYEMNNDGIMNIVESSTGSFTIASLEETNTYDINYYFYNEYEDCFDVSTTSFDDVTVLFGENTIVEFPVVNDQSCEDISVYLINQQSPRPGFSHTNYLVIKNLGLITTSGTVDYTLDSDLSITNISTNSNYTTALNANGFTLDFVNLLPGQSIVVTISLLTPTSVELGDMVTNSAIYTTSSNDIVLDNNESSITEEVIGSYDPNDKMESHGKDIVYDDFVNSDEYLYYTIRFQNLGTADAINVRIEDVLDNQLDETTFQMLRSSHNYVVSRVDNNLEWSFENINLPAEQDDAEDSIGYVYFKVKPNSGYGVGDIIPNSAAIYFDFNAPIITNTYQTEFVETLSIGDYNSNSFTIFPNPAKDEVTIQLANSNFESGKVNIYDIQGKVILKDIKLQEQSSNLDISNLENGLYFVELILGNSSTIQKLIVD